MSRHDHAVPVVVGERLGNFEVLGLARKDAHLGAVINLRCIVCSATFTRVAAQVRSNLVKAKKLGRTPPTHHGCTLKRVRRNP